MCNTIRVFRDRGHAEKAIAATIDAKGITRLIQDAAAQPAICSWSVHLTILRETLLLKRLNAGHWHCVKVGQFDAQVLRAAASHRPRQCPLFCSLNPAREIARTDVFAIESV